MAATLELPYSSIIVDKDGRPTPWFAQILKDTIATNSAISNLAGDADDIESGITQRFREIAKKEIEYALDGTIETITYKDPVTDAVVATEAIEYNVDKTVSKITETDSQARETVSNITYNPDQTIATIDLDLSGYPVVTI